MDIKPSDSRKTLQNLRPDIPSIDLKTISNPAEYFQHEVLRPLLKYQNDLIVAVFEQYATAHKGVFFTLSNPERATYIEGRLRKDPHLRHFFLGILVGHFTMEEYSRYMSHQKNIRKRAIDMLIQRLQDQLS